MESVYTYEQLNLKPNPISNPIYALYGSHFNKWVSAQKIGSWSCWIQLKQQMFRWWQS